MVQQYSYSGTVVAANDNFIITNRYEGMSQIGSIIIYKKIGVNTWDTGTIITPPDGLAYDRFGHAISISENYLAVLSHEKSYCS